MGTRRTSVRKSLHVTTPATNIPASSRFCNFDSPEKTLPPEFQQRSAEFIVAGRRQSIGKSVSHCLRIRPARNWLTGLTMTVK
jgi:hypothetical protein